MKASKNFHEIFDLIVQAKQQAILAVNSELINLYWNIGKYISEKTIAENWGKSIVKNLSDYIQEKDASIKGFSSQNLWRMKQFFEAYSGKEKLSSLTREIVGRIICLSFQKVKLKLNVSFI